MDFTPEEAVEAVNQIQRLKNPNFFKKIWNAIVRFFKRLFRIRD
jgi:ParB family chromosome partitioning protein